MGRLLVREPVQRKIVPEVWHLSQNTHPPPRIPVCRRAATLRHAQRTACRALCMTQRLTTSGDLAGEQSVRTGHLVHERIGIKAQADDRDA